jgi:hypothetical protein
MFCQSPSPFTVPKEGIDKTPPVQWEWYTGDGTGSASPLFRHPYTRAGSTGKAGAVIPAAGRQAIRRDQSQSQRRREPEDRPPRLAVSCCCPVLRGKAGRRRPEAEAAAAEAEA